MISGIDASLTLLVGAPPTLKTVLLCHFDGANGSTFTTDSSASAHALTMHGNAALATGSKKFGTASLLSGTTGSITAPPSTDFNLTRQFTIEFWLNALTTLAQNFSVVKYAGTGPNTGFAWGVSYVNGGALQFQWSADGNTFANVNFANAVTTHDVFYGFAIDRDELGSIRMYREGAALAGHVGYDTFLPNPTGAVLTIGGGQDGAGFELDELRITNHSARYASDAGYAITTSPFTS